MSGDKYILNYWNVPGRGESIRVMLTLGGFEFENNFVPLPLPLENPEGVNPPPFDDGSWGKLKPETPWGTLPTLTLPSGEIIGQQRSVLCYLGKKSDTKTRISIRKTQYTRRTSMVSWTCLKIFGQY